MRNYPNLTTLLSKETTNPNPRQAAGAIEEKVQRDHTSATHLVFFNDRLGKNWIVLPIGPGELLKSPALASRSHPNGRQALAFCKFEKKSARSSGQASG